MGGCLGGVDPADAVSPGPTFRSAPRLPRRLGSGDARPRRPLARAPPTFEDLALRDRGLRNRGSSVGDVPMELTAAFRSRCPPASRGAVAPAPARTSSTAGSRRALEPGVRALGGGDQPPPWTTWPRRGEAIAEADGDRARLPGGLCTAWCVEVSSWVASASGKTEDAAILAAVADAVGGASCRCRRLARTHLPRGAAMPPAFADVLGELRR